MHISCGALLLFIPLFDIILLQFYPLTITQCNSLYRSKLGDYYGWGVGGVEGALLLIVAVGVCVCFCCGWWLFCGVFCRVRSNIINKIRMDEQDQFFVEPQIEEVRDIKLIESPNELTDKPAMDQLKVIPLKMVQIPKKQQIYVYRSFRFQHKQDDESSDDDNNNQNQSNFSQAYSSEQLVYQRLNNDQFNKINQMTYFSGAFLHRSIFLDGNYSQSFELVDALKSFYEIPASNPPKLKEEDLVFSSKFQSGNLFAAFKTGPVQYDLVMSNDVNSVGNNQWFYFSVQNMIPNKQYCFNVVNFTKNDSLFNYGMAPSVYSLAENKNVEGLQKGWKRHGKEVVYKKGVIQRQRSRRMYYKLSFKLSTPYEKDKLFIAHSYPYSCEKLNKFLTDKASKYKDIVTRVVIGKTIGKRVIQGLVICQQINKKRDNRKAVIIMARQHPGQTQGSYVCEGVIERLLAKNKQADFLLKNYVFHVIPMVNPDGVAFGHYRTNLSGKDLNRKWNITEKDSNCPEVASIKSYIQQLSKQRDIRFILDLHGHSKKLNSFFYGNPCPDNPDSVRVFPFVCSKLSQAVQYLDCTFSSDEYKRKAARVYLSFFYRLIHVYTFETSFYAYFKEGKKIQFSHKEFRQLGGVLINALFLQLEHQVKFQQSFQFNIKKNNTKEYLNSPFVKMLTQLKTKPELLEMGQKNESGSQSKPQETEINNEEMESIKPVRPSSTKNTQDITAKTTKVSRKGARQNIQVSFNRPVRNIKFLQISRVNSILPDKYQLGLQPIRKKQIPQPVKIITIQTKLGVQCQTESKSQLKYVQFKRFQIQNCSLSNSYYSEVVGERKYSSIIKSNTRNIIFKFDIFGQTTTRQEEAGYANKVPLPLKQAYSQTIITYSKEQGEKIRSSQIFPVVQTPERDEKRWARNNSIRVQSSIKGGFRRQAQVFFTGVVKKLITQKEAMRSQQLSNKFIMQKPLSIKKKQMSRK